MAIMSADDQQFLDTLSNIPRHLQRYSTDVADFINDNVDQAAHVLRESLSSNPWIPSSIRPTPPVRAPAAAAASAASRLQQVQDWIARHKILTGVVVVVAGTMVYNSAQRMRSRRKTRRAKKARNGAREEVVVIAGSPSLPLTKSLALDMERKGFIVYVVCSASNDQAVVQSLSRPDIRPLSIDTTDPPSAGAAIERFAMHLKSPQEPAPNVKPNLLTLKSIILIPNLHYQTSPIATIPPSSFADLFNTHLLQPILTIQAFLPLLTSRLSPIGERWQPPKVLVFTPSIISSINPPFHASEAIICSALSAFTEVLTAELRPLNIPVTHMQLGTFDFSGFVPARTALTQHSHHAYSGNPQDTLVWPEGARQVYGRNFVAQTSSAISGGRIRGLKGSSLRRLHNSVFDVIDGSITADTVRVGLGASVYGFVGRWAPRGLVSYLMGIRRVDELSTWKATSSYEGSSREESENGGDGPSASHEFVAVPSESNVWNSEGESHMWSPIRSGPTV